MGNIYKEQGDTNSAEKEFNKVLELSPDYSWAYFNLASIDYEKGDLRSAVEKLEKTIELNPKDLSAYEIYAKILAKEGLLEDANLIVDKALNNCGANGDLYYIQAQIYKLSNNREEFVKNMNNALKYNSTLSASPKLVKKELDKFLA